MTDAKLSWTRVAHTDDLPEGRVKTVTAGTATLCLSHFDGQWAAMDNRCPHQGGPLGEGSIETGADADRFDDPDCTLDADKMWCPPDRVQPDGWWVGLYFESSEPTLTGSLPFFDRIELSESIVFVEWEHPE